MYAAVRTSRPAIAPHEQPGHSRGRDPQHVTEALAVLCGLENRELGPMSDSEASALATLYRCYAAMLLTVARKLLGSKADAEDVVHNVFSRLPALLPQYRAGGLGGWLRQVTVNAALMHLRKARNRREKCLTDCGPDNIGDLVSRTIVTAGDDLDWALLKLPESLRRVVVLKYFRGYSHQQIAEALDISLNASEVRLCRALKQLRCWLTRHTGRRTALSVEAQPLRRWRRPAHESNSAAQAL
jgi:RNA polymerase sigma factor (sigma-70 family)